MSEPAIKHDEGKSRLDLVPYDALLMVGDVLAYGAKEYPDRNWERGLDWGRVFAATLRHLAKWASGERFDPDSKLPHLAHATADVMMLLALAEIRNKGKDTRGLECVER